MEILSEDEINQIIIKKKKEKKLNPQVIPSQDQTKVTLVESY